MAATTESAPVAPEQAAEPTNALIDDAPPPILKLPGQVAAGAQKGGPGPS